MVYLSSLFVLLVEFFLLTTAASAYSLPDHHPRVLVTPTELQTAIDRMYGSGAREPYIGWFERIQAREEAASTNSGMDHSLMSLVLLYEATGNDSYRSWYLSTLDSYLDGRVSGCRQSPTTHCGPNFEALTSMDFMWDHIPDTTKLKAYEASSAINAFCYHSGSNAAERNFSYHGAPCHAKGFMFAATFDGDPILQHEEIQANPDRYSFDIGLYITAIEEEMSPTGTFWQVENRIAGDPTYNSALPGDFGGMYDNIGYDTGEESWSIFLVAPYSTAIGEDRVSGFLHDRHRGRFHQHLQIPHTGRTYGSGENEFTEHRIEVIWNTQTDWNSGPSRDKRPITASKYRDPYMQYFTDQWRKRIASYSYDYYTTAIWHMLLFYDDSISIAYPENNPTAMYFSGPGLVPMRENWSDDAAFAVFIAGEGISRRYEDANSFLLYRKGKIFVHAGARIRFNDDNYKHAWYHIRSVSKNTMKVFDPDESYDVDAEGRITELHSGNPLVDSDNLGGQLFETGCSREDRGTYPTSGSGIREYRRGSAFPFGIWNTADITRYEHRENSFTYAVGDGAPAYTRKIDLYEREFFYLRPDVFVIFDRVRSADAAFTKVWSVHTVDEPVVDATPVAGGQGMRTFEKQGKITLSNERTMTTVHALLPRSNRIVVRGGDTIITSGHPLRPGTGIDGAHIQPLEIPRWLELFAVGPDTEGSVTIYGNAEEGEGVAETVVFDGTLQSYQSTTYGFTVAGSTLTDTDQSWVENQWADYFLRCRGGSNDMLKITANSSSTLTVTEPINPTGVWAYEIVRPLANTYYHWSRIDSITTSDMSIDNLTLSVPHYFDTVDADGDLYSFSPHTDGRDDGYRKRKDLGQWSLDIEATVPAQLDNFLNVITLRDPGEEETTVQLVNGSDVSGALVGDRMVVFAKGPETLSQASLFCPAAGEFEGYIMNTEPNTRYYYGANGGRIELSDSDLGGTSAVSSSMGILQIQVGCTQAWRPPTVPAGLKVLQ